MWAALETPKPKVMSFMPPEGDPEKDHEWPMPARHVEGARAAMARVEVFMLENEELCKCLAVRRCTGKQDGLATLYTRSCNTEREEQTTCFTPEHSNTQGESVV